MSMRSLVLGLLFVGVVSAGSPASADQCALVPASQVDWAIQHVKAAPMVLSLCKPCGEKVPTVLTVAGASRVGSGKDAELSIVDENGKATRHDLAYTYVQVGDGRFANLAKLVGCPTTDVDDFITYAPKVAPGAPAPGKYEYSEACGTFAWGHTLTVLATGKATYSVHGYQAFTELGGSLTGTGKTRTFLVESSNVAGYPVGSKPLTLTVVANGLSVGGVTSGCGPDKGAVTFLSAAAVAALPKKPVTYVKKTTTCKGSEPMSLHGGCMCAGTSAILNPCKIGGGLPEIKGNTCVHTCAE